MRADEKMRDEKMLSRFLDVKHLIDELHEDMLASVRQVTPGTPSTSRAYVRSVFAYVEGALSGMSALLVEGQQVWGWQLTDVEVRVLWDSIPEPSVERPQGGRATLTERTKQVFKSGRRLFGEHCAADFGGVEYRAFRSAVALRDRLMHPKQASDVLISCEELQTTDQARDWFRASGKRFFEAAVSRQRLWLQARGRGRDVRVRR